MFTYANSLCVRSEEGTCFPSNAPSEFHYFAIQATMTGDVLTVAGHEVSKASWYTFRHVFGSTADDALTVTFELVEDGRPLVAEPVDNTLAPYSDRSTSSFDVSELGSGYVWFPSIADGLELPIDEHQLRRGR